jgi:hypothetical protein
MYVCIKLESPCMMAKNICFFPFFKSRLVRLACIIYTDIFSVCLETKSYIELNSILFMN